MKTILVPTAGSATDDTVFATALLAAKPLDAHLAFLHIRIEAAEAIVHMPHADFARGAALRACFDELAQCAAERSAEAHHAFQRLCSTEHLPVVATPHGATTISASWREETNDALTRLLHHARRSDLVVVGRSRGRDGLPPDFLDQMLLGCGRPLLLAPAEPPPRLLHTIMVCWKETAASARAMTAAMPLLRRATRVLIATVAEGASDDAAEARALAEELAWSGIAAQAIAARPEGRPVPDVLHALARANGADLVVMGGYSRSRTRELIFGGCTRAFLQQSELPVLMLH